MDKRPPLGPDARRNLTIFGAFALLKALALVIFAAVIGTALTYLARLTYSAVIAPRQYESERAEQLAIFAGKGMAQVDGIWLATFGAAPSVAVLVTMGLGALVLRGIADTGLQYFAQRAAIGAKSSIRQQLLSRLLATGGVDSPGGTGATAVLLSRGLNALDAYYTKTLTALVSSLVIPLVLWLMILTHDWVSGLVIALTIPLIPVFMILIGKTTREDTRAAQADLHRLSDHVVELVKGLPVLIGLGREGAQSRALKKLGERYQKTTMFTLRSAFMSSFALELITTLSVAIIAVTVGVRLVNGSMGLDTALLALILAPECYLPLRQVGAAYHQSEDGVAALRSAQEVIDRPYPQAPAQTSSDRVSVKNLSVTYPGRKATLTNVYFSVKHGTTVAVVGDSGIGKSTMLGALAGTVRDGIIPTGCGEALQVTGSATGLGRAVLVAQNPAHLAPSLAREVLLYALGASPETSERAALLLDEDRPLTDDELRLSQDLLSRVGLGNLGHLDPASLSAGQLRRLAIARAIGLAQELQGRGGRVTVLVDEPTAHLDSRSQAQVMAALASLSQQGATSFIVTHDPQIAASAGAVLHASETARLVTWALTEQEPQPLSLERVESDIPAETLLPTEALGKKTPADEEATGKPPSLLVTLASLRELTDLTPRKVFLPVLLSVFTMLAAISLTALSGWLIVRAAEQPAMMYLMVAVVGVRFFGIGRAASRYAERLATHRVMLAAADRLRLKSWINASNTVPSVRQLLSGRGVLDRVVSDVDELRDAAPRVLLPLVTNLCVSALALIVALTVAPLTALPVAFAVLITLVVVPLIVSRADRSTEEAERVETSRMLNLGVAALDAAPELSANRLAAPIERAFASADQRSSKVALRGSWAAGLGQGMVAATWWTAALASIALCWPAVRTGELTAPMLSIVVLMCTAMLESSDEYVEAVRNLASFSQLTAKVRDNFPTTMDDINVKLGLIEDGYPTAEVEAQLKHRGETLREELAGAHLELRAEKIASRWPGMDQPVFTDLSLTSTSGSWTGITGPSGSGKSTALAVLLGFLPLEEGELLANGRPLSTEDLRGFAAWCPQSSYIFESSIASNLAIARAGSDRPSESEMYSVLDRVGLGDFVRSLDRGLETPVGAGGSMVSGGQRQRLAVARTLLTESPLLLLDEPTAHLDEQAAGEMMQDLDAATRAGADSPAVIVVSHRGQDIARCDHAVELAAGGR